MDVTLTGTDDLGNPVDITLQTDANGDYMFRICGPPTPTVTRSRRRSRPGFLDGSTPSDPSAGDAAVNDVVSAIAVAPGDAGTGYTFGEVLAGSLAGSVFEDVNNDGVLDAGEAGIAGVDVTLTGTDDLR